MIFSSTFCSNEFSQNIKEKIGLTKVINVGRKGKIIEF